MCLPLDVRRDLPSVGSDSNGDVGVTVRLEAPFPSRWRSGINFEGNGATPSDCDENSGRVYTNHSSLRPS